MSLNLGQMYSGGMPVLTQQQPAQPGSGLMRGPQVMQNTMQQPSGMTMAQPGMVANTRGGTTWQRPMQGAPNGVAARPNAAMGAGAGIGGYNQRLGAPGTQGSGYAQQQIGAGGNPNQQQMTPQVMAMISEFRRRAALSSPQRMVEDRGVFAGGQQAQTMAQPPPMNLPQLWAGG